MIKNILVPLAVIAAVVGCVVAMSAFEAHVINVTAKIENALSVPTNPIMFGTVFPNEVLYKDLLVKLSDSFVAEPDADDVKYEIRQKPKPTAEEPTQADTEYCVAQLAAAEQCVYDNQSAMGLEGAILYCYGPYDIAKCYPPLCPFLSKMEDLDPDNDQGVGAPHPPGAVALGVLAKDNPATDPIENDWDLKDLWKLDLKVPCFIGNCAQSETGLLPIAWEKKDFGCDLWIEVTDISRFSERH